MTGVSHSSEERLQAIDLLVDLLLSQTCNIVTIDGSTERHVSLSGLNDAESRPATAIHEMQLTASVPTIAKSMAAGASLEFF